MVESTARDRRCGHTLVESLKTWFMRSCQGFVVPGKSSFQYLRNYGLDEKLFFSAERGDTEFFAQSADASVGDAVSYRQRLNLPPHFFFLWDGYSGKRRL